MNQNEIEKQKNWKSTYRNTRNEKIFCLMVDTKGGFYWHEVNYNGSLSYGETSEFSQSNLEDAISRGILEPISCANN